MRRCLRSSAISLGARFRSAGRPSLLPFALAFASPAFTLSPINDRSNWATAPIIWNISSPAGNEVSTASVTETKSIPNEHIALQVQKVNRSFRNNKGVTFLMFDENKAKADTLAEFLWDPPAWTDDYYGKKKKQEGLDQLIDSAFTVKSHHAELI